MTNVPSIKNIVFDLGNVIVDLNYDAGFAPFGVSTQSFDRIYNTDLFHRFEKGHIEENEFFDFFCDESEFRREHVPDLKAIIHRCFPLRPRVWDLVYKLKNTYRIFLLSNTNTLDFTSIEEKFDIRQPFEKVYLSYEQGHRKPDEETYLHAQTVLNILPEETLFLDDRIENIAGAGHCGWHTVHVLCEETIFSGLEDYHILPLCEEGAGHEN